jgi:septal ring-binding cell division protein DamX
MVAEAAVAKPQQPPVAALAEGAETSRPSGAESPANQGDMLSERLQATLRWLATQPPHTLSIQLLAAENANLLREHLSTIAKSIEATDIYVYRTVARQRPFLAVLYGSFDSREAAQRALERLPPPLKAFKPYLRTVEGIREEISRRRML